MPRARLALLLLAACGGSSSRPAPPSVPRDAPLLLERPVWDGPLDDADAKRLLDRVRTALDMAPPALTDKEPKQWADAIKTWLEQRAAITKQIRADAEKLATGSDPRMKLLATVALGVAADDLMTDMAGIELPAAVKNAEYGDVAETFFREQLEDRAVSVATMARVAFERCRQIAPVAPAVLQPWAGYCGDRATELAAVEARVSARVKSKPTPKPPAKPPALFADCDSKETLQSRPAALPPNMKVKPSLAYIYSGFGTSALTDPADIAKLEAAVAAKLGKPTGMKVLSGKELAAARALVEQKKLHPKGPVCGQAPRLTQVVAHKVKHLVVGQIETVCLHSGRAKAKEPPRCSLGVRYYRAGSTDQAGLPAPVHAPVPEGAASAADYIAAVDALAPDDTAGVFGGLLGSLGSATKVFTAYTNTADDDPWLGVGWTLREQTTDQLASCVDAGASFDASFTVTGAGKTTDVVLAAVTAPPDGSKVTECVKRALEATPWPCTRDGKPAKVAVRMCVAPHPK